MLAGMLLGFWTLVVPSTSCSDHQYKEHCKGRSFLLLLPLVAL